MLCYNYQQRRGSGESTGPIDHPKFMAVKKVEKCSVVGKLSIKSAKFGANPS